MRIHKGLGINGGKASGILFRYQPPAYAEPTFDLLINQKETLQAAIERSIAELETAVKESLEENGDAVRMVFESHKLMVNDPILLEDAMARIDAGADAYHAYSAAANNILDQFRTLKNDYMRNRVIDIIDATDRVLHQLVAAQYERDFAFPESRILLMDQIRPSVIRNCRKPHVEGFIAEIGTYDQHSSMIARSKDMPGVVIPHALALLKDGAFVTIDGDAGIVAVEDEDGPGARKEENR
jgi:phosphotransferase system enzyme I (PtsI)